MRPTSFKRNPTSIVLGGVNKFEEIFEALDKEKVNMMCSGMIGALFHDFPDSDLHAHCTNTVNKLHLQNIKSISELLQKVPFESLNFSEKKGADKFKTMLGKPTSVILKNMVLSKLGEENSSSEVSDIVGTIISYMCVIGMESEKTLNKIDSGEITLPDTRGNSFKGMRAIVIARLYEQVRLAFDSTQISNRKASNFLNFIVNELSLIHI